MVCGSCKGKDKPQRYMYHVMVEKPGTTTADDGTIDKSDDDNWIEQFQIVVNFITKGGSEGFRFRQTSAETDTIIHTPWSPNTALIKPSWQIRWGTRVFNIGACYRIDERGRVFQIEATERREP
jgi:hypothetical protein